MSMIDDEAYDADSLAIHEAPSTELHAVASPSELQTVSSPNEEIEPLLDPRNDRFTIHPIKFPAIWKMYKDQQGLYWKAEEISYAKDKDDFLTLQPEEQHFIKMILAFFASSDGIVNFNLRERFLKEIRILEAQVAYGFQMMMESVHSEVYSDMLNQIVENAAEREYLFNSIKSVPSIKLMADWALKWVDSGETIAHRIMAFAAVEGIFFSGAFAAIFWLKIYRNAGKDIMNGLVKSNEFISRDEGMHVKFACLLYSMIIHRLDASTANAIIREAVDISKLFNKDAIRCDMIGMNLDLMYQYIEYIGDTLLVMLGYEKIWNSTNPFGFMESIGLLNKTNFHESRPTEYQSAFSSTNVAKDHVTILDDF